MNPYTDFVKSLTDAQLDALNQIESSAQGDANSLAWALDIEWEQREHSTHLTVYTPDLTEFRRQFALEMQCESFETSPEIFQESFRNRLAAIRLLPGWTRELEAALVKILLQLVEQLP